MQDSRHLFKLRSDQDPGLIHPTTWILDIFTLIFFYLTTDKSIQSRFSFTNENPSTRCFRRDGWCQQVNYDASTFFLQKRL
eukprot:UN16866